MEGMEGTTGGEPELIPGIGVEFANLNPLMQTLVIEHKYGSSENPAKLKLMKMSKGYQWEISLAGNNFEDILEKIKHANEIVEAIYGNKQEV